MTKFLVHNKRLKPTSQITLKHSPRSRYNLRWSLLIKGEGKLKQYYLDRAISETWLRCDYDRAILRREGRGRKEGRGREMGRGGEKRERGRESICLSTNEIINLDRELSAPLAETKRPKRSRLHVKYARNENCQWPDTTVWLGATAR